MGRLIALSKVSGGVRGIVAEDIVPRLVARTVAQQLTQTVDKATSCPICFASQFAREVRRARHPGNDRSGSPLHCLDHRRDRSVRPQTEAVMMDWLFSFDAFPFVVHRFNGYPSGYLWEDGEGTEHQVLQGE